MKTKTILLLAATHIAACAAGFALGIYYLPILAAPPAPSAAEVQAAAGKASFQGEFKRALKGSDALHWGEGKVSVGPSHVTLVGSVAPGPAYKLYLVPKFVETNDDFRAIKSQSLQVGDVKTFDNFIVPLPAGAPLDRYDTVLIWCEAFSQFITAARYR
ncbi:DM13 domain-containing protein [Ramlibacter sp.]|uniref:DM13 domain-containing protein n=1 Tax=Ramlibacter sp. TaxID=1917967 RepID=UPI003D0CAEBD